MICRKKFSGFSIIEIMTTIAIMAILVTISAPNYQTMRIKATYQGEVQSLLDTIVDARNAAITNRKCVDGTTFSQDSKAWKVVVQTNPLSFQLKCFYDETNSIDQPLINPKIAKIEDLIVTPNESGTISEIIFSFFSGPANGKLEYKTGSTTKKASHIRMVFGFSEGTLQSSICFNPVSGFPTFNKHDSTCQTLD